MIEFKKTILENGLTVIVHEDHSTPLIAMNIIYRAGSCYDNPELTGLAHLMEHLMFSGSVNIPEYDTPLQQAGGENNAYTNNDIASYFLTIPAENVETALWLESDRMISPSFSVRSVEVQKKVVIEEFRQRYLNQPYGDIMHLLRPVVYQVHPYRWPTIGMTISHIEKITPEDVTDFFFSRYSPHNAILSIAGNIETNKAIDLINKWFGDIPDRKGNSGIITEEPVQESRRVINAERNVPSDLIYKAWPVCKRKEDDFPALDLLTDILSGGESGRLHEILVREKKIFSEINAYLTGDQDTGLLLCHGKLMHGTEILRAEDEIDKIIGSLLNFPPESTEMEKVMNRFESTTLMSNVNVLNKSLNLCYSELTGDAGLINAEIDRYRKITSPVVSDAAARYLTANRSTTIYYKSLTN